MNVQCSGGSRSFAKETRVLKMRSTVVGIRSWQQEQLRAITEAYPLTTTWEAAEELNVNHSTACTWSKLERWKNSVLPHELIENKKNCSFEVLASLILCNNEPFLDWIVTSDEKWILYDNQWWLVQWLNWEVPKHFSKPNQHQKKIIVKVWWSAVSVVHYSFMNPGKTIISEKYAQQINEIYRKLQRLQPAWVNRIGSVLHDNIWPHITQSVLWLFELG